MVPLLEVSVFQNSEDAMPVEKYQVKLAIGEPPRHWPVLYSKSFASAAAASYFATELFETLNRAGFPTSRGQDPPDPYEEKAKDIIRAIQNIGIVLLNNGQITDERGQALMTVIAKELRGE